MYLFRGREKWRWRWKRGTWRRQEEDARTSRPNAFDASVRSVLPWLKRLGGRKGSERKKYLYTV
jgi:hypothetical protein